jgi:hypothetical protein
MTKGRVHICVDFPTRLLPSTTECVVFTEIPTIRRVNHTVEACVIVVKVPILVIILTPKFRKLLFQGFEDGTLDDHKPGRSVENLYEPVRDGSVMGTKINDETRGKHGHVALVTSPNGIRSLIPHDNLFGITRNRKIVFRLYETHDCGGIKVDIGIYEHKIFAVRFLHKATYGHITGTVDEGLVFCGVEIQLNTFFY